MHVLYVHMRGEDIFMSRLCCGRDGDDVRVGYDDVRLKSGIRRFNVFHERTRACFLSLSQSLV
jgi:hypothetical protein